MISSKNGFRCIIKKHSKAFAFFVELLFTRFARYALEYFRAYDEAPTNFEVSEVTLKAFWGT